jgi:hypothetical protein
MPSPFVTAIIAVVSIGLFLAAKAVLLWGFCV